MRAPFISKGDNSGDKYCTMAVYVFRLKHLHLLTMHLLAIYLLTVYMHIYIFTDPCELFFCACLESFS